MANIQQARRATDEYHISRKPIVQYKSFNNRNNSENYIKEDTSNARFEELYNEFFDSFRQAYKTYINNLQGQEITYANLPYYDGKIKKLIEAKFTFKDIEHCFGLPTKGENQSKQLVRKLIDALNESNKKMTINKSFNITDNERYFLFEVDNAIEEYVSNTSTRGFQVVIENIYERLKALQEKYPDNIEVQKELMYQSRKIHKMLTKNTEIRYTDKNEEKKYYDSTFIDESCKLIIKQLSKKTQNIDVLNLNKMYKGTNKLVRVIRRNLSSFEINPDKNTLVTYLGANEKKIKNQVIEHLTNKYLRDVIKDDKVLEYALNYMIEDSITGKKILDAEFIKNNISSLNATILKDYNIEKLYDLIKSPDDTKSRKDIIENVNNLVGAWNEIERRKEVDNTEELEMVEDLIDLKFHEMLSNKDYQVEFTKRSITKEVKDKLGIEINNAIANTNLGIKAIRNFDILSSLFINDEHNYIEELSTELNETSYTNLEQRLTELELKTRRIVFEMEAMDKGFENVYSKYEIVDMIYFLCENSKVKEKLRNIYNNGEDSINYKKIADKSEVISDLSDISNYQMIIRRVREKVTDQNNNIFFPEDNYLVSRYPTTSRYDKNNIYVIEIPISNKASSLVYFPYDNTSKTFKPSNVLSNIELINDQNNNKILVAKVDNPGHFLATENNSQQNNITIESSVQYNLSLATALKDTYYERLKKEHNQRFNNINSVSNISDKSEFHDMVYKFLDLGEDSKLLVSDRKTTSEVYKSFPTSDKNTQISAMFKPITEQDLNNKKI